MPTTLYVIAHPELVIPAFFVVGSSFTALVVSLSTLSRLKLDKLKTKADISNVASEIYEKLIKQLRAEISIYLAKIDILEASINQEKIKELFYLREKKQFLVQIKALKAEIILLKSEKAKVEGRDVMEEAANNMHLEGEIRAIEKNIQEVDMKLDMLRPIDFTKLDQSV